MEPLMTVRQVARIMRVRSEIVQQWIRGGLLPAVDVGTSRRRSLRIAPAAVQQLCESLRAVTAKPRARGGRKAEIRKDFFPDLP